MANTRGRIASLERKLVEPRDRNAEARARELLQKINEGRARVGFPPLPVPEKIVLTDRKVNIVAAIYDGRKRARSR